MSQKYITPTLRAWMTRVGAVQISLKKFVVKTEDEGGYPIHGAKAIIAADGKFVADEALKPTGEKAAIQAEVAAANFPKWIRATKGEARNFMDTLGDPNFVFPFFDRGGDNVSKMAVLPRRSHRLFVVYSFAGSKRPRALLAAPRVVKIDG
jgi:hypothetical protein